MMHSHLTSTSSCHYALMSKLPQTTVQRAQALQLAFAKEFQFPGAVIKYPHITLLNWTMNPQWEDKLCRRIQLQASKIAPQQVVLRGFETLTKAFCINVANREKLFYSLFSNRPILRNQLKREAGVTKLEFITHPHITLARRLTDDQLDTVTEKWQYKQFEHEFVTDGFVLLRYTALGESQVVNEFSFSRRPGDRSDGSVSIQATLF